MLRTFNVKEWGLDAVPAPIANSISVLTIQLK